MEESVDHSSSTPTHRVFCGDCRSILPTLPEHSVDVVFADPPYNLQLRGTLRRPNNTVVDGVMEEWDRFADYPSYDEFTRSWVQACRRVLKPNGFFWVIGTYHNIFRIGSLLQDLGFWILNDVIWVKTNPMPNFRGTRFQNATETLILAQPSPRSSAARFQYHAMKHLNDDRQMPNVWYVPICTGTERLRRHGRKAHPTQKPEALLYRVILSTSQPNDVILDPFFGTGTTGVVAKRLGRSCIGIEQRPDYVELAEARLSATPWMEDSPLLSTPSRRTLPRITIGDLIAAGYLTIGQSVYTPDGTETALLKADGHLWWNCQSGSIHDLAARVRGSHRVNGWDFWHIYDHTQTLVPLHTLRERYAVELGGV